MVPLQYACTRHLARGCTNGVTELYFAGDFRHQNPRAGHDEVPEPDHRCRREKPVVRTGLTARDPEREWLPINAAWNLPMMGPKKSSYMRQEKSESK
jgi:hypothetical protein